jgi:hypothetical protein
MIYTAPCVRFLMRADTLRGEVGGGGVALETSSFVGPCEIARAVKDKKSKRSNKAVGIKVFLTFFAW